MTFGTQGLDHVALVVADMERSIAWYADVLAMERRFADVWDGQGDPVVLCNGDACVALFEPVWDHTICHSLYIRDPDGHQVELTTYDVS